MALVQMMEQMQSFEHFFRLLGGAGGDNASFVRTSCFAAVSWNVTSNPVQFGMWNKWLRIGFPWDYVGKVRATHLNNL